MNMQLPPGTKKRLARPPDVYALAVHLAQRYECTYVIDLGCGQGQPLAAMHPVFEVIGIDSGEAIRTCRSHYDFGQWLDSDLDSPAALALPPEVLRHAVIICDSVIDHLQNPDALLTHLHTLLDDAPVALLTTATGDLTGLMPRLEAHDLRVEFAGHAADGDSERRQKTLNLVVLASNRRPAIDPAPDDFRVVALLMAYNEADIILPSLQHLIAQGLEVYLLDNWSTDGTFEQAQTLLGKGLIGLERFPASQPEQHKFDLPGLLRRDETLTGEIDADWFMHHDVDELRESPWPEVSLRDAIYHVDRCGYNCIDFTVVEFHPVDSDYPPGSDLNAYFRYFRFGSRRGMFTQWKAWKRTSTPVELASSGGHRAQFPERRIYPYNFLLKHYPLRTIDQARRKILERQDTSRQSAQRGRRGHLLYNHIDAQDAHFFEKLRQRTLAECAEFEPETFYADYLVERIARVGLVKDSPSRFKRLQKAVLNRVRPIISALPRLARPRSPGGSSRTD